MLSPLIRPYWFDDLWLLMLTCFSPSLRSLWLELKVCCRYFIVNKKIALFTFNFSHQNSLCVAFRANKHVECISYLIRHLQSQFLYILKFALFISHAVFFFFFSFFGTLFSFHGALLPLPFTPSAVDWNLYLVLMAFMLTGQEIQTMQGCAS